MRFLAKTAFAALVAAGIAAAWSRLRSRPEPAPIAAGSASAAPAPAEPAPPAAPAAAPAPAPSAAKAESGEAFEGYCVKERKRVQIKDPERTTTKNGRPAVKGTCPDCGTKIFRFLPQT